jgi:alpha-amylase
MAEAVDHVAPLGRVYLPDSSYREMTEWALPAERQVVFHELVHRHEHDADWGELKQFVRGGFWRNFLAKYPESNEMYCRMREISDRLEELAADGELPRADLLLEARQELYRGQCNCPYWHGAFGGLYLPHLRNAIYRHLIAADTAVERARGVEGNWVRIETGDFNLDARQEVKLASERLAAYFAPARGGHLYELDVRSTRHNLLATLNRRPEAYHAKVVQAANRQEGDHAHAVSIHDLIKFKHPDLDKKLQYDVWPRKSLVDHFFRPELDRESFEHGEGEIGDFLTGVYETTLREASDEAEIRMTRSGRAGQLTVRIEKRIALAAAAGSLLEIHYELSELPPGARLGFAVEFNFAGLAAGAEDRYFYDGDGRQLGQLQESLTLADCRRIGVVDEWIGIDAALDLSRPADIWTFPIQTVSQSEGGFELVHQSSVVLPNWTVEADASGRWEVGIQLSIDTSVAEARRLAESSVAT